MDDLSFSVLALDKAASETFIRLSNNVERLSDRLERLDRKTVTANVHVKTDDAHRALDSFTTRFTLMTSAVVAASPVVGGAILGGIGAGFTGVAVLAQKSNEEVQETYGTLWRNVVTSTKNATDQLVPQIVGAGRAIDANLQQLAPQFQQAFSFAGPGIVALSRGVNQFATNAMPGLTMAMRESQPVAQGIADVLGQLGTAVSDTAASLSQHADEFGTDLQSAGHIATSALGAATDVVNTLGVVWAHNAADINSATDGMTASVSGLAQGALPALDTGLAATVGLLNGVAAVLEPLAPLLGGIGTTALVTWGAFKVAGVAAAGVRLLAAGVVSLGASMEAGAARTGVMIAGLRGVDVAASTTARTVTAAGAASATAAVRIGAAASALAGPLGIALLAGTALLGFFTSQTDSAADAQRELTSATDTLTSAFESSQGAVNASTDSALQHLDAWKGLMPVLEKAGISQEELLRAVKAGGAEFEAVRGKLRSYVQALEAAYGVQLDGRWETALNTLSKAYQDGQKNAAKFAEAQLQTARSLLGTTEFQQSAASAARTLGLNLGTVSDGFSVVISKGTAASNAVQDVAGAYFAAALNVASAGQQIKDHFATVDKAVTQAQRGVADAARGYEQSSRAILDAQRQVVTAKRSLRDAYDNVAIAQQSYTRAQEREKTALVALNQAREKAVEDLKALHQQLEDQVTSEESAQVRLFEAQKAAAEKGVTLENARTVAAEKVNDGNLEQVKAAIDLVSAQNAVNNVLNTGTNLRKEVAAADRAGVAGAPGVVSAQEAVRSAHEEVSSAKKALERAQQSVTDAAYAEQRAHQQVTDAQYQNQRAADQLTTAERALAEAQAAAGRGFDLSTKAGQDNLRLLLGLWKAIGDTGVPQQERMRAMVEQTAAWFGISTTAAAGYLKQLGLIPQDFRYGVTAVAGVDLQQLERRAEIMDRRFGRLYADGGAVVGVGGPRDDANLIWASAGEFIQPADTVGFYGVDFMEALRRKRVRVVGHDGVMTPRFADGGYFGGLASASAVGATYQSGVTALTVMGFPHPPALPRFRDGGLLMRPRSFSPSMVQAQLRSTAATPSEIRVSFARGRTPLESAMLEFLRTRIQVEFGGDVQAALGS